MARTGVTYSEVEEAATQLVGLGKNPTVEQVRFILKTGSSTTIAKHLRQWRESQASTNLIAVKENIPTELVALMKGLWERVVTHSEEKITAVANQYQQTLAELEEELEKYKSNNQRWQKLYEQWLAEKNQFATQKLTLEQALEFAHKENVTYQAKQDSLLQQLQDKQERINELHRLHKQTQDNLEHFRESTREQRLLDLRQYEQQKEELQSEIKLLNHQITELREKLAVLQNKYQEIQQEQKVLQSHLEQARGDLQTLQSQFKSTEQEKLEYLHASEYWQGQHNDLQKILQEKNTQLIDLQTETNLSMQKLTETKEMLKDVQNQNKLLVHDKWILAQEKASLEGQLKQMQKMITA